MIINNRRYFLKLTIALLTVPVTVALLAQAGCDRESGLPDFGGVTGAIYR